MSQPDADRSELDGSEEVVVPFVVSGCDGSEVFEFVEEALDEVSVAIEEGAEGGLLLASWHGLDVGPCAPRGNLDTQGIGVVGAVGEQDVTVSQGIEHVACAAPVMGLAGGQLESDRQSVGIDQRVDLGCKSAARATHATGSVFFWALAPC